MKKQYSVIGIYDDGQIVSDIVLASSAVSAAREVKKNFRKKWSGYRMIAALTGTDLEIMYGDET